MWTAAWAALAAFAPQPALATEFDGDFAGTNDFGGVGLLQTPTARMRRDGEFGFGISADRPYNQLHVNLQVLPWVETVLRYAEDTEVPYGASALLYGNNQHYKDKSADVKFRLLTEDGYLPSVALGMQDLLGTGVFSSEYLVASHHYYDFDFTFGLAWGRLGAGGNIPNPFRLLGNHFNRVRVAGGANGPATGGKLGVQDWFTGKTMGAFGGVQWNTPLKGLALRLEYDGNDYQHEALQNLPQATHFNAELDYTPWQGVELGVGYERGNKVSAHVDFGFNFNHYAGPPKVSDPPLPPLAAQPQAPAPAAVPNQPPAPTPVPAAAPAESSTAFVADIKRQLAAQGIDFDGLTYLPEQGELQLWFSQDRYRNPAKAIGRVARVLCNTAPDKVARFALINVQDGLETYRFTLPRADFEAAAAGRMDANQVKAESQAAGPVAGSLSQAQLRDNSSFPRYSWNAAPALRQNIGGPDEFYATQFWAHFDGGVRLTEALRADATVGVNIWNNFDKLQQPSNSTLPHVRSDISEYLKEGPNNLVKLETNYIWSPADDLYARASAGLFEEMYGGVAGELLYRPYGRRWAVGLDANWLRQRAFNQRFSFLDYQVATGFLTLYYEVPYDDILVKLTAGRYLARDKGATLDLSRRFANGVRCGVFATKTNVSSAQFGEGSFDKGLYITIPIDLFFTTSTRDVGTAVFRPLTRDGGQRARDGIELYGITGDSDPASIGNGWGDVLH